MMFARVFFFVLAIAVAYAQKDALSCRQHPIYRPSLKSPLIRSFDQHEQPTLHDNVVYQVNFNKYVYRPRGQPKSTKYEKLDLFHNTGLAAKKGRLSTLYFQRSAIVYMFIGMSKRETRSAKYPGWKSEGYAELQGHKESVDWTYGVWQKDKIRLPKYAYVFSKKVTSQITLPTKARVINAMRPLMTQIHFHFRIAEANGKPYAGNMRYLGKPVLPNRPCPASLHKAWRVRHTDNRDPDVRGQTFSSWHPMWDPCFWCTYGHDHGASAKHIMGYEPTFTYAAWKNKREKESDEGFKSYVMKYRQYWLYVNFHVQVGQLRRVSARYHTIAITLIKISTGEKMIELTHKADFGFLSARGRNNVPFVPLTKKDDDMMKEMAKKRLRMMRTVNVINPAKPDRRFSYRDDMFQGVYEAWQTVPMCSAVTPVGGIQVDIRTSASGIKTVARKEYVALHLKSGRRQVGLSRVMRVRKMTIGTEHCPFKTKGGYFYTSADGKKLFSGPGRGRIRQFIKPGFRIMIDGRFEPLNAGLGLHGEVLNKMFWDHGGGMNPDKN